MKKCQSLITAACVSLLALVVIVFLGQVEADEPEGDIGFEIERVWRSAEKTQATDVKIRVDIYLGFDVVYRTDVYETTGDRKTWHPWDYIHLQGQPAYMWGMDGYKDVGETRWIKIPDWLKEAIKKNDPPITAALVSGDLSGKIPGDFGDGDADCKPSEPQEQPTTSQPPHDLLEMWPEPIGRDYPPFRIKDGTEHTKPAAHCLTGFMPARFYYAMKFKLHVPFLSS